MVDAFMAENEQNSYGHSIEAHNHHQLIKKTPSPGRFRNKRQDIREMEDIGDFGNDLDVPPSVRASQPKPTSPNGSEASLTKLGSSHLLSGSSLTKSPKGLHLGSKSSLNKSASRNHDEQSIYVEAEITWNGLYNLLEVVSEQLHTTADKLVYKGDPPAKSVRDEIVSNANRGHMLSYMDTTSLSMVILDQLPLLSAATQEHCILHDNILFKQMKVISLAVVQSQIKPILQGHWNKLYEHFTELLKCRAMSPQEIAETFAPHMISYDSPYETQAVKLLAKLLEETLAEEGMNSQHSTSTFSATPRPKPAVLQKANDSDLEDDIFDHEVPQNTSTVALTQSAAYRQVVGSTLGSTQKSVSYIDSTEEVDDIERELFRGSTKRSSSNDSPARILPSVIEEQQRAGSFRGTTSPKGIGSPAREGALSPASLGSGGMRSPSPHSTGGAGMGGGYVPSGLGDTGRSVAGQSTMSSLGSTGKKMAFMYGDSDTDEDIELPGTEKNARPEEDDFYS